MKKSTTRTKPTIKRGPTTWIYQSAVDDEDAELEFELDFQSSLTTEQRYRMMIEFSRLMQNSRGTRGHSERPQIVQRE